MYRLTMFVLISCVTSQRLVGAVRRGGSPSGRSNLYFDSYDHPSLEEFEESEDGLREAVLMQPEEVLDIPPIPVARDYDTTDHDIDDLLEEYPPLDSRNPQMSRGLFHDWLQQIQAAFSKWPPGLPTKPETFPEYYYHFDSSLVENQQASLRILLAFVEEKTCNTVVENEDSPKIIFMGIPGCSIEAVENKIIIGYDCFEPTMILKLIFMFFGFCPTVPVFKKSGIYLDSFRNKLTREPEEDTSCKDVFGLCFYVAKGNRTFPCSSASPIQKSVCPRTCRICGDNCVDYDPDCNTGDTLKDCLLNWGQKKIGCANTCGVCKNLRKPESCFDYLGCCVYYAKRGYCPRYPKLMKEFCPLSCGYCKPKSCVDERSDCPELKNLGGCTKMASLMEKNCRRTCNMCGNELENRDNEDRNPPENCNRDDDFMKKYCSWDPIAV